MRLAISALALLVAATAPLAAQDTVPRPQPRVVQTANPNIGTLPLNVNSDPNQQVQVARNDSGDGVTYDNQYQSAAQTYLIATGTTGVNIWSGDPADGNVTPVSNTATTDAVPETLVTQVSNSGGILVTHTISYVSGSQLLQHTWLISNQNANHATFTNAELRYGGDISYTGLTQGVGVYDATTQHLYVSVPTSPGLMTYYADATSPFSHHYEAPDVEAALNTPGVPLPDTVNSTYQDSAGMGVEWDLGTLAYNTSKTVIMYEAWDTPGFATVSPPATLVATTGTNYPSLQFSIENDESSSDTFTIDVNAGPGISTVPTTTTITVPPLTSKPIIVALVATQPGIPESSLSLLATSSNNPAYFSQGMMLVEQAACALSAPPSLQVPPATQVSVPVTIQNLEAATDTFAIAVSASSGVTLASATFNSTVTLGVHPGSAPRAFTTVPINGPLSLQLQANASTSFTIQATVAANAATPISISLSGESATATAPVASDVTIPITLVTGSGPGGGPVTLPAPTVAVSTPGHVVFYPLCPATTTGVASLQAFLNATAPTDAVGFCWDATTQAYVEYPALPSGGILPTTGMFVATAVPMDADFSGTPAATSAAITLEPGWNLVGVPPIATGGATVTAVTFPTDFTLAVGGTSVTTAAVFADDLGIAGSDLASSAEPYYYNGSAYAQVNQLDAGTAYWFHNNLATIATLTVSPGAGIPLTGVHRTPRAAAASSPPPAPTTAPAASNGAATSGRCGAAAGVVMLVSLALWWRRRRA